MIFTTATMSCSDRVRPLLPAGASLEYGIEGSQAPDGTTVQGTTLPPSAFGAGGCGIDASAIAPTFETKQAHVVGARAWSPPV